MIHILLYSVRILFYSPISLSTACAARSLRICFTGFITADFLLSSNASSDCHTTRSCPGHRLPALLFPHLSGYLNSPPRKANTPQLLTAHPCSIIYFSVFLNPFHAPAYCRFISCRCQPCPVMYKKLR